ncbi:helix-turn-helix domain-containing protein [Pseudonocardia thermophila]|uniref:helix-turn-helix domain-containing protein n=1 Tax=Pseudonocardia thermophila TaxID=1848 RepID=UPI00248D9803|nr:helix-turn-helix domain-containing protein [Pseudonocardia thermophila]
MIVGADEEVRAMGLLAGRHTPTRLLSAWMSAVADVVRAVNAAKPLEDLLARIAEQARLLIGFDYCAVMLVDDAATHLAVRGSSGLSRAYVEALNREHTLVIQPADPEDDTPAARAYREGVTLAVPNLHTTDRYGSARRWAQLQGFGALVASPLVAASGPIGVVVAYSRLEREFTGSEVELVELLAQHAVLALETAELRHAQERTIAELQRNRLVLERAETQHRSLMQLLLDEAGLQRLAESLAEALEASITIEDADEVELAVALRGGTGQAVTPRWRRRPVVRAALRSLHERYAVATFDADTGGGQGWVAPVVLGGQLVGRVWGTGVTALPEPAERRIIERFALVVGVELLKRRFRVDTENRLVGDLFEELLRLAPAQIPASTVERAATLGHDLAGPQVLAVVAADADLRPLVNAVRAALTRFPRPLVGFHGDALAVILPADPDPAAVLTVLHERVATLLGTPRVATVLGPVVTGRFGQEVAALRGAARLCPPTGTGGVLDLRELGLVAYLLRVGVTDELCAFVDALLAPVEEYDGRRGSALGATLRVWLAVGCSVPAVAREMTLHPNTVAYRLGKAEQLLGRDLRSTQLRMELQLAFTVRDIQQARSPARPDIGDRPHKRGRNSG